MDFLGRHHGSLLVTVARFPVLVSIGLLPLVVLAPVDAVGPRLGLDARRSRRLAFSPHCFAS